MASSFEGGATATAPPKRIPTAPYSLVDILLLWQRGRRSHSVTAFSSGSRATTTAPRRPPLPPRRPRCVAARDGVLAGGQHAWRRSSASSRSTSTGSLGLNRHQRVTAVASWQRWWSAAAGHWAS